MHFIEEIFITGEQLLIGSHLLHQQQKVLPFEVATRFNKLLFWSQDRFKYCEER